MNTQATTLHSRHWVSPEKHCTISATHHRRTSHQQVCGTLAGEVRDSAGGLPHTHVVRSDLDPRTCAMHIT